MGEQNRMGENIIYIYTRYIIQSTYRLDFVHIRHDVDLYGI